MRIEYVETLEQALGMAYVRNTGKEFMTNSRDEITPANQAEWFDNHYLILNAAGICHAFIGYEEGDPMAYGLVNRLDEDFWVTWVISPKYQGSGYGEELFRHLSEFTLDMAPRVMLNVLATNVRAQNLYRKLGYKALTADGDIIVMCLDKEDYEPKLANV